MNDNRSNAHRRLPGQIFLGVAVAVLLIVAMVILRSPSAGDDDLQTVPDQEVVEWVTIVDFPEKLALYRTVFWEPRDSISLRELIRAAKISTGKSVLEIGTGSGLISLCCAKYGATRVVATDINPNAVACARFNAKRLQVDDVMEVRQVSHADPSAYAVLKPGETFDLIISNPPWENKKPRTIAEFAEDDEDFALMTSLLQDLKVRLNPGGRAFLAYGCVTAIRTILQLAPQYGLKAKIHDDRKLDDLPEVFLPGMLVIVWVDVEE